MTETPPERADALLESALARRHLQDPRPALRARLRELRGLPAFDEAVRHYEETLVPGVAAGDQDPVEAWIDFGRRLGTLQGPGQEVAIDPEGRRCPAPDEGDDHLLLFLPDDRRQRALPLRVPELPSPAQAATLALLVEGRLRHRE